MLGSESATRAKTIWSCVVEYNGWGQAEPWVRNLLLTVHDTRFASGEAGSKTVRYSGNAPDSIGEQGPCDDFSGYHPGERTPCRHTGSRVRDSFEARTSR